jgi:hypothetical protein
VIAASASAAPIIFTASGTAGDGRPENGKATINFASLTSMTITLENTAGVGQLGGISSVLDGFALTFPSAPTGITLTGVTVGGLPLGYDCTSTACVAVAPGSSPFGWGVMTSGTFNGVAASLATPLLAAGNGSYKPLGIVNNNITHTDGIPNTQHNNYLNGPVTFSFTVSGLTQIPNVTAAKFYFGTVPDSVTGTLVPEPATLAMLSGGLVGLATFGRRYPHS